MTNQNEGRKPMWRSADFLIGTAGVAIFLGWCPAFYLCGFLMVQHFPLGALLLCDTVLFWLLVAAFARFAASRAKPSRRSSSLALLSVGTACLSLFFAHCGLSITVYIAGVRARLQWDMDPKQLRQWVMGITPDGPQKEGATIHLPNGETITPTDWRGDGAHWGEDGSFTLLPAHLPSSLATIMRPPPGIIVHGDPDPVKRFVEVGYGERFGLTIVIGPTNFVYVPHKLHFQAVKWADGMYVFVQGGG
jgi:hypothetical protein